MGCVSKKLSQNSPHTPKLNIDKYLNLSGSQRLIIGIAGIPGSGKTTLAALVASRLNARYAAESPGVALGVNDHAVAAFIPMDGYHLTRAQLSAMPDPTTAHARRGAAFTFDARGYLALVKKLRVPIAPETQTIYAPSFDHQVKDPVDGDVGIARTVKVCLLEGNYVALDEEVWREASALMDEIWFVEVDEAEARRRLVWRHVKSGIAKNEEEAGRRADENDLVNGREIMKKRVKVHEIVKSVQDEGWSPESQSK